MLGFTNPQIDRRKLTGWRYAIKKLAQFFKRIRLQLIEILVHGIKQPGVLITEMNYSVDGGNKDKLEKKIHEKNARQWPGILNGR